MSEEMERKQYANLLDHHHRLENFDLVVIKCWIHFTGTSQLCHRARILLLSCP
jgi:hypothetical protein